MLGIYLGALVRRASFTLVMAWIGVLALQAQQPVQAAEEPPELYSEIIDVDVSVKGFAFRYPGASLYVHIDEDGERYLPLIALLGIVGTVDAGLTGKKQELRELKLSEQDSVWIDPIRSLLFLPDKKQRPGKSLPLMRGIADIAGQEDYYLAEEHLEALGFDGEWREDEYKYRLILRRDTFAYVRYQQQTDAYLNSLDFSALVEIDLPETSPPSQPRKHRFSFDVVDYELLLRQGQGSGFDLQRRLDASLELQGQLFYGNYELDLSHPYWFDDDIEQTLRTADLFDRVQWRWNSQKYSVSAGDTFVGLDRLVIPSNRMFGASVAGVLPLGFKGQLDLDGSQLSYYQSEDYTGLAPVGSKVELRVNNNLVAETQIPLGAAEVDELGRYEFRDITIRSGRVNEVTITVIEPDGQRTVQRDVVQSAGLSLPGGVLRYDAGLGVLRGANRDGQLAFNGHRLGARLDYGVTNWLNLGVSWAANQEDDTDPFFFAQRQVTQGIGWHGGLQLYNHLRAEYQHFYRQQREPDGETQWLQSSEAEFRYVGRNWYSALGWLDYAPEFATEQFGVSDKRGFSFYNRWKWFGVRSELAWASLQQRSTGYRQMFLTWQPFQVTRGGRRPLTASMRFDISEGESADRKRPFRMLSTTDLTWQPFRGLRLGFEQSLGDQLVSNNRPDLRDGIRIPLLYLSPELMRKFSGSVRLMRGLSVSGLYAQTGVDLANHQWQGQFSVNTSRYWMPDWRVTFRDRITQERTDWSLYLSQQLLPNEQLQLGASINYSNQDDSDDSDWSAALELKHTNQFINSPQLGLHRNTTPSFGSYTAMVSGMVYLDANANGQRDPDEKGVEGIRVRMPGHRYYETDASGMFIGFERSAEQVPFYLDPETMPAGYIATQGTHKATLRSGKISLVNLGIAIFPAVTGQIVVPETANQTGEAGEKVLEGVKVQLISSDNQVSESITDSEGFYYFDSVTPGEYRLQVVSKALPEEYRQYSIDKAISVRAEISPDDAWAEVELAPIAISQTSLVRGAVQD